MHNAITVGRMPKYTVFLHGYTHFIHEWVTFRVPYHRGFHLKTGEGAKGYIGHASFKYNIHVAGFVETSGGLRSRAESLQLKVGVNSSVSWKLKHASLGKCKNEMWHDHLHCSLTLLRCKLQLLYFFNSFFVCLVMFFS